MRKTSAIIVFIVSVLIITLFLIIGSWRRTAHGKLDPAIAVILKYSEIKKIDLFQDGRSVEEIRKFSSKNGKILRAKPVPVEKIDNRSIPGTAGSIPVRIYTPSGSGPFPVVIYYHGGGWVIGDLDSHDNICRKIANRVSAVVLSVGYRLAPEHTFPAAAEDAYAALKWASTNSKEINGIKNRIAVAGDSAGGNLSAVVSLMTRDRNGPAIAGQVLIYPATNLSEFNTVSYKDFSNGYYLTKRYMEKFRELYLPDRKDWNNPYASPLLANNLKGLPPALVITDQFDVLRDEGEAYAERLKEAGVPVRSTRYSGVIHGFVVMDRITGKADDAVDEVASYLKKTFNKHL